jgi:hypothetical protein
MAFGLEKCNSRDHGGYDQDSRNGMRQHVVHDIFRRLGQLVARDKDPDLLL